MFFLTIFIVFINCNNIQDFVTKEKNHSFVFQAKKGKSIAKDKDGIVKRSLKDDEFLSEYSNCPFRYVLTVDQKPNTNVDLNEINQVSKLFFYTFEASVGVQQSFSRLFPKKIYFQGNLPLFQEYVRNFVSNDFNNEYKDIRKRFVKLLALKSYPLIYKIRKSSFLDIKDEKTRAFYFELFKAIDIKTNPNCIWEITQLFDLNKINRVMEKVVDDIRMLEELKKKERLFYQVVENDFANDDFNKSSDLIEVNYVPIRSLPSFDSGSLLN